MTKTELTPYAAVPSATNNIGIGFMLYSAPNSTTFNDKMNGFDGSSGGGMGGGGFGGGGSSDKTKVNIWANVTLATK